MVTKKIGEPEEKPIKLIYLTSFGDEDNVLIAYHIYEDGTRTHYMGFIWGQDNDPIGDDHIEFRSCLSTYHRPPETIMEMSYLHLTDGALSGVARAIYPNFIAMLVCGKIVYIIPTKDSYLENTHEALLRGASDGHWPVFYLDEIK